MPIESSRLRGGGNGSLRRPPRGQTETLPLTIVSGAALRMKGWRFVWFWILATTFFLALCRGPSLARPTDDNAEVGHGLVCDTAKQLERFVVLLNEGNDTLSAIHSINKEGESPIACGIIIFAFIGREPVEHGTIRGHPVSIVKVSVVAVGNGSEWKKVPATTQYAIFGEEDLAL
jgi:hypothetical protein